MEIKSELKAGDVVVRSKRAFLVVLVEKERVKLVSVKCPGSFHHRAHVRPSHWFDLAESGLGTGNIVFACDQLVRARPEDVRRIGRVSEDLLGQTITSIVREQSARAIEGVPGLACSLVALTASSGRRVGVVRFA